MTGLLGISRIAAIALGAALSMTAGLAFAADDGVPEGQIVKQLQPATRGLSITDPSTQALVERVRNKPSRSLTLGERQEIAEISAAKPNIDLDIQFDYNSARISQASLPAVQELGKALSNPVLKGSTFVVAGHTDAVGGDAFNQDLSERRADTIRRFLSEKYGIDRADLITIGYGKTRLKDPGAPTSAVNRRVQIVNLNNKTASK